MEIHSGHPDIYISFESILKEIKENHFPEVNFETEIKELIE